MVGGEFFLHRCFSEKIEVTQEFQFLFRHNRRKDTKCGMTWQFLITLVVSEVKKKSMGRFESNIN